MLLFSAPKFAGHGVMWHEARDSSDPEHRLRTDCRRGQLVRPEHGRCDCRRKFPSGMFRQSAGPQLPSPEGMQSAPPRPQQRFFTTQVRESILVQLSMGLRSLRSFPSDAPSPRPGLPFMASLTLRPRVAASGVHAGASHACPRGMSPCSSPRAPWALYWLTH